MIIRIVKMTFLPEQVEAFKSVFKASKEKIRAFEGCQHLELLAVENTPNIMMTYSWWKDADALEQYRHSELFKTTWAKTKVLFSDKPEAWSLNQLHKLD